MKTFKRIAVVATMALFLGVIFAQGVEARRGRGGRGGGRRMSRPMPRRSFNRRGPASRGSFSAGRRTRPSPSRRTRPVNTGRTRPSSGRRDRMANRRNRDTTRRQDRMAKRDERRPSRKDRAAPGESKRQKAQKKLAENREDWQEFIKDRQEDRQDFIEDLHDDHWDRYHHHHYYGGFATGVVVGSAATVTYVTTLPCTAKVVDVNGVHYYSCGSTWYRRSYSGSDVTYIVVDPPPGY